MKKIRTIALLTTGAIDPNNQAIWAGTAAACRDQKVNLICYPGRLVRSPIEFEAQRNIIYNMVNRDRVDGIVLMGGLNAWVNIEDTFQFLKQFETMPIVTTGIVLEGIPGVTVDNYHGMYDVVTHLVEAHNRRRIAFIRGQANHQEALDRYQAYLDVLRDFKIPFDPELVFQGDFKESGGVAGVKVFLEERHAKFDALVAASDNMAIGAMKTLQSFGIRIPSDVAIAGVNGEDQGLVTTPPLTTAPLHFYEQAYQATLMVLSILAGEKVPHKVVLPTRLMIRQSCGCSDPLVTHAEAFPHIEKLDSFTEEIRLLDQLVFGEVSPQVGTPLDEEIRHVFPTILKLFLAESQGKLDGEFLDKFSETLELTSNSPDAFTRWHEILSVLRCFAISQLSDTKSRLRIENLVHQARVVIGEGARRHHALKVLQADEKLHILGEISQSLSVTNSISELIDVLERSLRLLDISTCYLFLYENPEGPDKKAKLFFAYENFQRIEIERQAAVFPTSKLLPDGLINDQRQFSLVVEPIYFREDQLGYAVFAADPHEEAIYEILGGQISASLKRNILTERNIRLYNEALQARKAAEQANRLKSQFLSMVSHELRTPLALIIGTIEMMLQEEKLESNPSIPAVYQQDMESIHSSSKHLFRLIGDVLDLASNQAGELRLSCEPIDLVALLNDAAILGKSLAREKNLQWLQNIPVKLPVIWGDRTRLRQVVINLLSNAVKFTENGFVSLSASENDAQIIVEIQDTGMGIPLEDQEVIFDEFRRSERSVSRGYGGIGLGLAITRRLIELHGGEIGVKSAGKDGKGSTFFFILPTLSGKEHTVEVYNNRRNTVLLLFENTSEQQSLQRHLQQKGFEVEAMNISQQADWLAKVMAQPPGAVVLDFQPAKDRGWKLMQLLKQNPETRDIPVVFYSLSAESTKGSILELDYLTKPIGSADLSDALERLGINGSQDVQKILVVDDDPKVLEMHVRMLESQVDCCLLKANGGKEALDIIRNEDLSLIILDLMMPEIDGFEVLRVMREHETTRNIPVIVLTAQILTNLDMQRLQDGVAAVLSKGVFNVDEVLDQVENALNHSKRLGSQTSRIVRQAMAFIHEHYAEPLSRNDLSTHVAITERYLTSCFRQELGITPMEYLNRYRIKRAMVLLEQQDCSITTIAMDVGFSDTSYFNRVFKQKVGLSPGAYRRGERVAIES